MSAKKMDEIHGQQTVNLTGTDAVRHIRSQLKMHEALGIHDYPLNDDMVRFFELTDQIIGSVSSPAPPAAASVVPGRSVRQGVDLSLLREEMNTCTQCSLAEKKLGTVQGSGKNSCRLMILGDWSQQDVQGFSRDVLFGPGEDDMLWKMMAAIGLAPDQVYVTNCIKCCPGQDILPDAQSEESCFSYLEREVVTVQPDVICTMGELAARIITGSAEPLTRLRGKFLKYRYGSAKKIDVMPTFHPRFLLKFADMKKAAWLDLQAVKRRLDETG